MAVSKVLCFFIFISVRYERRNCSPLPESPHGELFGLQRGFVDFRETSEFMSVTLEADLAAFFVRTVYLVAGENVGVVLSEINKNFSVEV